MGSKNPRILSSDVYHLSTRIRKDYMYRIRNGTKNVEFRPPTQFWETRCTRAMKFLKAGKEVHLVLLNGKTRLELNVMAIGKMTTGPNFWDNFSLGTVSQSWTPGEVWAILMGDIIE